jgi:hypothetical protein
MQIFWPYILTVYQYLQQEMNKKIAVQENLDSRTANPVRRLNIDHAPNLWSKV